MVDYGIFKALQGLLFFGAVFAFGFWQLASLRRSRGKAASEAANDSAKGGGGLSPSTNPRSDPAQAAEAQGR